MLTASISASLDPKPNREVKPTLKGESLCWALLQNLKPVKSAHVLVWMEVDMHKFDLRGCSSGIVDAIHRISHDVCDRLNYR
jgi:hypothetical protein